MPSADCLEVTGQRLEAGAVFDVTGKCTKLKERHDSRLDMIESEEFPDTVCRLRTAPRSLLRGMPRQVLALSLICPHEELASMAWKAELL